MNLESKENVCDKLRPFATAAIGETPQTWGCTGYLSL